MPHQKSRWSPEPPLASASPPVGPYLHKGHWPQLEGAAEVSQLLLSLPETRENSVDCTYGADHQHRLERLMVHVF